jgi:L-arabinose isomerase
MIDFSHLEAWFVPGSQHLYGPETLKQVEDHATTIVRGLSASSEIPLNIVAKPVMTSRESIHQLCLEANSSKHCIGLIAWMHTFSPARMWMRRRRSCRHSR